MLCSAELLVSATVSDTVFHRLMRNIEIDSHVAGLLLVNALVIYAFVAWMPHSTRVSLEHDTIQAFLPSTARFSRPSGRENITTARLFSHLENILNALCDTRYA